MAAFSRLKTATEALETTREQITLHFIRSHNILDALPIFILYVYLNLEKNIKAIFINQSVLISKKPLMQKYSYVNILYIICTLYLTWLNKTHTKRSYAVRV